MILNMTETVVDQMLHLVESLGYLGVMILIALEYACFPLPSEVILPFVGFTASQGHITYIGAIIASVIAGIIGSLICYYIGYFGGTPLLVWVQTKFPKSKKSIAASEQWFEKYGSISVMIARVFPLARTYISIPAGIARLNIVKFVTYSSIGIIVWNIILISLGFFLGENWNEVVYIVKQYSVGITVVVACVISIYLYRRYMAKKKHRKK